MRGQRRSSSTVVHAVAIATLVLGAPGAAGAAGDVQAGREKARQCQACHGIDGIAKQPNAPHLAGESAMYLEKQLRAFRAGERQDPQMSVMAKGLSDEDIADLAAWYSAIEIEVELPDMGDP